MNKIFSGRFLVKDSFLSWVPAIVFACVLISVFIANRYYAETKLREMNNLEREIKVLQKKYIDQKGEYQKATQMLEIEKRLEAKEVKIAKDRVKYKVFY